MIALLRRNPLFARLWMAQVVSQAGDWLNRMAVLTSIGTLGGREAVAGLGALYGVELAFRLLPAAMLGPIAGPIADRLPRRVLLVTADLLRAVVVAAMCLVRDPAHLAWLYVLIALQMGFAIFFDAARSAALPDTVQRGDLLPAHTLSAATWSVMLSVGALAGGGLVAWLGPQNVFLIDAATYLVSAWCLRGLRLPPVPKQTESFHWKDIVTLRDLRRGQAHARSLGLGAVIWAKTFWGGAGGFLVVLSLAGQDRFGGSSGETAAVATGILYAARGLGTGVGPLLAQRIFGTTDRALYRQIVFGFAVAAAGYAAFGFAHDLGWASLWVGVAHLGGATLWVASTVLWQKHVDVGFRGRVFAFEALGMDLGFAAGALFAGAVYDATGSLAVAVWVVAGLVLVLGSAWGIRARAVGRSASPSLPADPEKSSSTDLRDA